MPSSETAAPTLASLVGSRDVARVTRLIGALGQTLAAQIADGKTRLVHPAKVLVKTSASGDETIEVTESLSLAGAEAAKDPALDLLVAYVAPEVLSGKPDVVASTVYHLAAIAYHLLTGEPPFSGSSAAAVRIKVLLERPASPRSLRPELPLPLDELLLSSLDKKSEARPPSIEEFLRRLAEAKDAAPVERAQLSPVGSAPPSEMSLRVAPPVGARRGRSVAVLGLLAAVVLLGAGALFVLSSKEESASAPAPMSRPASEAMPRQGGAIGGYPAPPAPPGAVRKEAKGEAPTPPPPPAPASSPKVHAVDVPAAEPAKRAQKSTRRMERPQDSSTIGRAPAAPVSPSASAPAPAPSKTASRSRLSLADIDDMEAPAVVAAEKVGKAKKKKSVAKTDRKIKGKGGPAKADTDGLGGIAARPPVHSQAEAEAPPSPEPVEARSDGAQASGGEGGAVRGLVEPPIPTTTPAPSKPKKTLVAAILLGVALFAGLAAIGLLWVIRRDQRLALQTAKTQTKPSDTETLPSEKREEPKSPKGEIDPFTVGQYTCFARLGEGGMGMVYKARHTNLDREAAVKVLSPSAMIAPDAIELFQREAKLASQINHPNSVFIYDYGNVSGALFYLVMEFIDGQSLDEIISPKGKAPRPLPLPRVLAITKQICSVLDTAHGQGIVHRDAYDFSKVCFLAHHLGPQRRRNKPCPLLASATARAALTCH